MKPVFGGGNPLSFLVWNSKFEIDSGRIWLIVEDLLRNIKGIGIAVDAIVVSD
jgi:hypothetical protein